MSKTYPVLCRTYGALFFILFYLSATDIPPLSGWLLIIQVLRIDKLQSSVITVGNNKEEKLSVASEKQNRIY
ncbi:MAG: hypothetical protein P4L45_05465 [Ignavibacteriaceae bacterium]|nr:hypothetical protein [Ignavibacteriaceae bacterium]